MLDTLFGLLTILVGFSILVIVLSLFVIMVQAILSTVFSWATKPFRRKVPEKEPIAVFCGVDTCEVEEGVHCPYMQNLVLGMSDYAMRCTKYHTRKQAVLVLQHRRDGKHLRLPVCKEENG